MQLEPDYDQIADRLERPRRRRQQPLVWYHHKRWGHGNSREMINRVGRFSFMRAGHANGGPAQAAN